MSKTLRFVYAWFLVSEEVHSSILYPYLNTEITPIDVVPEEKVSGCRWGASYFKQLHQVKELSMNIPTHYGKEKTRTIRYKFQTNNPVIQSHNKT